MKGKEKVLLGILAAMALVLIGGFMPANNAGASDNLSFFGKDLSYQEDDDYEEGRKIEKDKDHRRREDRLTREEVKKIALNYVGGGFVKEIEVDDGIYEVKVIYKGREYKLDINPKTGQILEVDIDEEDDIYENNFIGEKYGNLENSKGHGFNNLEDQDYDYYERDSNPYKEEKNKKPDKYEDIVYLKINKVDEDREGQSDNNLDEKDDYEVKDYSAYKPSESQKPVSSSQAMEIALNKSGGEKIKEFELDDYIYEIEIIKNNQEIEVEIDYFTGKILEFEID